MNLEVCSVDVARLVPNEVHEVRAVPEAAPMTKPRCDTVHPDTGATGRCLEDVAEIPHHSRQVHFGFEAGLWELTDFYRLGDLLCKYSHRFSASATDLGRDTIDPFTII